MDKILVVIGARAGSKGVKDKNIRPILGKPLLAYSIETALKWKKASRVVVSTESQRYADIAKQFGAEVPFLRPAEMATDTVSKGMALRHAFMNCEKMFKEQYDILVDLDVTAPVRTTEDLDNCFKIFAEHKPQTLFSVVEAHKNPYFNMVEIKEDGKVGLVKDLGKRVITRQSAPKVYAMNASIYFYAREHILKNEDPSPFSVDQKIYVMDDLAGIDVDREIDFKFIEFLMKEKLVNL